MKRINRLARNTIILPAGWTYQPAHSKCPECGCDLQQYDKPITSEEYKSIAKEAADISKDRSVSWAPCFLAVAKDWIIRQSGLKRVIDQFTNAKNSAAELPETKVTVHIGPGLGANIEERLIDKPDGTRVSAIYYEIYAIPAGSSSNAHLDTRS